MAKIPSESKTLTNEYDRLIWGLVREWQGIILKELTPALEANLPRVDSRTGMFGGVLQRLELRFERWVNGKDLRLRIGKVGAKAQRLNKNKLQTLLPVSRTDEQLRSVDAFIDRNVALITSIAADQLTEVRKVIRKAEDGGSNIGEATKLLQQRFGVSRSRARLIARDQLITLQAQMTQDRMQRAGIEEYIWTTSNDDRVRESHEEKDGQRFSFNNPPSDTGNPGDDVLCRCIAYPILPDA